MEGAPSKFRPLTYEENLVFAEAIKGLEGVGYEPLAVSTQVVNGTMYRFLCNATVVRPESVPYLALVYVVKLTTGQIKFEKVTKLIEEE